MAEEWGRADVSRFLEEAGLGAHASAFAAADVDGRRLMGLHPTQLSALLAQAGESNAYEQNDAAAEVLTGLIEHLHWRSAGGRTSMYKQEL